MRTSPIGRPRLPLCAPGGHPGSASVVASATARHREREGSELIRDRRQRPLASWPVPGGDPVDHLDHGQAEKLLVLDMALPRLGAAAYHVLPQRLVLVAQLDDPRPVCVI